MTRGAGTCSRHYDHGSDLCFAPREHDKPFADSERAQKWRLSLASLLFFTVLLSDHLWVCAEAKLARTRDKGRPRRGAAPEPLAGMGEPSPAARSLLSPSLPPSPSSSSSSSSSRGQSRHPPRSDQAIFLGNSTNPLWRLETCYPRSSPPAQCFSVGDAEAACRRPPGPGQQQQQQVPRAGKAPGWNLTDFYLSFCNAYTLWDLFAGPSNPDTLNCSLDAVLEEEGSCSQCVQAYQRYDQHAQEKYEEFEVMLQKYLQSDEYSVKSCPEDCKISPSVSFVSTNRDSPLDNRTTNCHW